MIHFTKVFSFLLALIVRNFLFFLYSPNKGKGWQKVDQEKYEKNFKPLLHSVVTL